MGIFNIEHGYPMMKEENTKTNTMAIKILTAFGGLCNHFNHQIVAIIKNLRNSQEY